VKDSQLGSLDRIFPGSSEMAHRMRSFDWSKTVLGLPETWPLNLRTCVRIILTSRQPMFVWWGEQLIHLYNDGYTAILGAKHPTALAQPAPQVWSEVWDVAGPRAEFAMRRDEGTYDEALPFIMLRKGYPEETYVTFSYSPIPDDRGGFGGILCPASEDTQRIIGERQLALLRELPARTADARTWRDACRLAASAIETNPNDLPFALIYTMDRKGGPASLAAAAGIGEKNNLPPEALRLDNPVLWPLEEVCDKRRACQVADLTSAEQALPQVLGYPVQQAIALPIALSGEVDTNAILVAGLNPLRAFDDNYRSFLELVAAGILAAMVNAETYEAERRRAEALAELDRAKTVFFSNVSHEFRTPLTLLLGPLEDELREHPNANERLTIAHRNALRLLKLVNTLLDFSRIEAGRIQAVYEPTDLGTYTAELASVFRSAIEKAGLRLIIDCSPLREPVYVDREMWEKIVLNLISNAFKFTFEGEISVSLRQIGEIVELTVRDTGTGIPESEVPHLFERFHRVKGARGRSLEGSGIGLALVQELVKVHGGTVRVESEVDRGSTFAATILLGSAHLPDDRVEGARPLLSTGLRGEVYVEEALRWLPEERSADRDIHPEAHLPKTSTAAASHAQAGSQSSGPEPRPRILLADDNADMRDYVGRLLSGRYEVVAAIDGEDALRAARERAPDLVLTDVMMPRLDGFGLLKELRSDERLKTVPVILLSARAGEEASVEGIASGADDYLIKPFSARELVTRVDSHLKMARLRAEVVTALRESEAKLEIELADAQQLQRISSSLIPENKVDVLYDQFLAAACSLMRSDMASIQMLSPERQALLLLAHKGFAPESTKHWEWVEAADRTACSQVLARGEAIVVPDVELWDLVKGTKDLSHFRRSGIRAILSTPLLSRDGHLVGVISTHWCDPHQPSERELRLLEVLARQAADLIERRQAEEALRESEKRMRLAIRATRMVTWEWVPAEDRVTTSDSFADLYGQPALAGAAEGLALVAPEDREAHTAKVRKIAAEGGNYTSEFRINRAGDGSIVWLEERAEAQLGADGKVERVIGVTLDITERKQAEERRALLMSELNHRVKNTLATVQAIASQTLRGSSDPQQFVENFESRLQSLSRAHNLLTRRSWESANVTDLVRDQMAVDGDIDRIKLLGPEALLTPQSAVALALVLHELGTNARKYGALSTPHGSLDIQWRLGAQKSTLEIEWAERGGSPVIEPRKRGFGTTLIEKSLAGVGGSAELRFHADGLRCAIRVPLSPKNNGQVRRPDVV
jgi:PAS domain S-box-containing protein